eukprot:TRINITY_DN23104_c0_g1_i1.p1 TRINITY_DN23104_c0_g1~~TRINITY_DN23104_c0_g1_i1.p1  ORF type:complete len:308 (-),score=55.39 TRINITY_DN23104_c0_g1_i1:61-945(-)
MAEQQAVQALIAKRRLRFRFMMHDAWENALFVHWPVEPAIVAKMLPGGLEPDIMDGSAWVGLVLLTERGVSSSHPWGRVVVPPIDHFGANVRTYVLHNGVPGIFFWSLECSSILASLGARMAGIPYFPASMERRVDAEPFAKGAETGRDEDTSLSSSAAGVPAIGPATPDFIFDFSSTRSGIFRKPAVAARWQLKSGDSQHAEDFGRRARWFVERYSVYAAWPLGRGPVLLRGDVTHPPWPVQSASLEFLDASELLSAAGLHELADLHHKDVIKPHVCFSRGVGPVEFWMLEPV